MPDERQILLPPLYRTWSRGAWHLYFDPRNFAWVRVNETGRFILERLARHRTEEQIGEEAVDRFGVPSAQAARTVTHFVDDLVASGFLHRDRYVERQGPRFGTRKFAYAAYLHLTNDCNLRCTYCYNRSDRAFKVELQKKGRFAPILSTEEYVDVIGRLVELGVGHILFTGGEPLMRPDCLELMEAARAAGGDGLWLEVLTNGILLKQPMAERLCDVADAVTVSLDGHRREEHERQRGKNTFAPALRGVRTLVDVRNRRGRKRPTVTIVPTLTRGNVDAMPEIFSFVLDDLGADGLAPILFQAGDHQELGLDQIPPMDRWLRARDRTADVLALRRAREEAPKAFKANVLVPRNQCGAGHGEISIDPSGFVYPCQSLHRDEFLCGNVRERDLQEIYDDEPVMQRARAAVVDRIPVCGECDLKYLCHGGCRATAYTIYGDFEAYNRAYCEHLETLAVDRLWASCDMPLAGGGESCV